MSIAPPQEQAYRFTISDADKGQRLDAFLAAALRHAGFSREKIKRLIRDGRVRLGGQTVTAPRLALVPGAVVEARITPPASRLKTEEGDIDIVYRDALLAVINKPAGLTVHPAPGRPDGTLAHRLPVHFPELAAQEGFRPGIVHRLDKDTSGLMLVALSESCRLTLAGMFARHEVFKEYLALVRGVPERTQAVIDAPIGRHPACKTRMAVLPSGRPAKSARRTLYADPRGRFALEAIRIFSGRTHQVRVHMRHIGHPLLGDALYADSPAKTPAGPSAELFGPCVELSVEMSAEMSAELSGAGEPSGPDRPSCPDRPSGPDGRPRRQMLHAWKLAFVHPEPEAIRVADLPDGAALEDGRLSFRLPPPPDFSAALRALMRRCLRVVITGSPGCGKSALLGLLREAHLPVFSADAEVARLYQPGADGQSLLRRHFGERFVPDPAAPVDKIALGAAFRDDPAVRREVEALLHPLVYHALTEFWRAHENHALAVAEVPLYLESGRDRQTGAQEAPLLVGVHCPYALREKRLREKRGWDEELVARMESWQWPEEKKMRACDIVVPNTGSLADLAGAAEDLITELRRRHTREEENALRAVERLWNVE